MNTIPVLDLNAFDSENPNRQRFIEDVGNALKNIGFFALSHHGIKTQLITESYDLIDQLYRLPHDALKKYENTKLKGQRGYVSFAKEHAKDNSEADLKEFWHVGQEFTVENTQLDYPKNVWPSEIPQFKPTFCELFRQLELVSFKILQACALFMGEKETRFSNIAVQGNSILRLIHYPPIADTQTKSIRAAAHEDINLITLLISATASGLQILTRDNKWVDVVTPDNCIIIDAGDMLQNITNGFYKSTTHRVINPDDYATRRYSMPFFVHAVSDADLSPLPTSIELTGGREQFPRITAGDYLVERLTEIGLS